MSAEAWVPFLQSVDDDPLPEATLKEVAEKLAAGGLRSPKDLEGSDPAEVAEAVGGNAGLRAFARRVHGRAAAAAAAAAASAEHAMGAGGSEARASRGAMPQPE
eukprot:8507385-Pyramimonas_sp.AAC.1